MVTTVDIDEQTGLALRSILRVNGNVIGALEIGDTEVDRFGSADLSLCASLAVLAAFLR